MSEPVIIDTDPGIDDALAIMLALCSPELQISAITTVSGNVPVEIATRNVFRIMALLPASPRFPVARGAPAPLQKNRSMPPVFTARMDWGVSIACGTVPATPAILYHR